MAIIHEETQHEYLPATISVTERVGKECRPAWEIVSLEYDSFENLSPKQLRELGKWLIAEGKRIGREYKSNGAPNKGGAA